jgi:hypothetical protein
MDGCSAMQTLALEAYRNALSVPGEAVKLAIYFAGAFQHPWTMKRIAKALNPKWRLQEMDALSEALRQKRDAETPWSERVDFVTAQAGVPA